MRYWSKEDVMNLAPLLTTFTPLTVFLLLQAEKSCLPARKSQRKTLFPPHETNVSFDGKRSKPYRC